MTKEIQDILNLSDNYANSRKDRRKGSGGTQEWFTPHLLVSHMADKVPVEKWSDPISTWLEPSFGNGAFLVEIVRRRIQDYNIHWKTTLETLYGVELMEDNCIEAKDRIIDLLKVFNLSDFNESIAREIMNKNLVCANFFDWDFENWRPINEYKTVELF